MAANAGHPVPVCTSAKEISANLLILAQASPGWPAFAGHDNGWAMTVGGRCAYNSPMNVQRFVPSSVFSPQEIEAVRARSDVKGLYAVVHAWAVIGAMMALYALWPNPLTFLAAVIVIGSRQLGL